MRALIFFVSVCYIILITAGTVSAQVRVNNPNALDSLPPNITLNRNPDGTIRSVSYTGETIYKDVEGKVMTREEQEEFLITHDNYTVTASFNKDGATINIIKYTLKRKNW